MKNLTRMAIFAALTAICSQIIIPLPLSPVPFTGSLIAVFLTGAILKPKYALGAQMVYLLLGAIGLPVFTGFGGGLGVLVGTTGGYLAAYPIMAFVIAYLLQQTNTKQNRNDNAKVRFRRSVLCMIPALCVCYILGSLWLSHVMGMDLISAFIAGTSFFVILDFVKILVASWLAGRISKAVDLS